MPSASQQLLQSQQGGASQNGSTPKVSGARSTQLLNQVKTNTYNPTPYKEEPIVKSVTPQSAQQDSLVTQVKKIDISRLAEAFKGGAKQVPGQVKQAGGIIAQAWVDQNKKIKDFFNKIPGQIKPFLPTPVKIASDVLTSPVTQKISEPIYGKVGEVGEKLRQEGFVSQQKAKKEYADKTTPASNDVQKYAEAMAFNLPQMLASTGLSLGVGIVTKNPQLATAVGLSTSFGLGASEVYNTAREEGVEDDKALPLAYVGGAVIGALDFVPLERLIGKTSVLEPVKRSLIKRIASGVVQTGIQAGFEGITEGLQEIVGNAVQATYSENKDLFKNVKESIIVGGLLGGFTGATIETAISAIEGVSSPEQTTSHVEAQLKKALKTNGEDRTTEQKEIVNQVLNKTFTPDQAIALVASNDLTGIDSQELVKLAIEGKQTGKNIQLLPSEDGNTVEIILTDTNSKKLYEGASNESTISEGTTAQSESKTESKEKGMEVQSDQQQAISPVSQGVEVDGGEVRGGLSVDEFKYTPANNLDEKSTKIEKEFGDYLTKNLSKAEADYTKKFGNVLNTDNARELSDAYNEDRATLSPAVHEPSSAFINQLYKKRLNESPSEGMTNTVVFTAGGTGAGKTTAINTRPEYKNTAEKAQIVYDTNLASYDSSEAKIEQALKANKPVTIIYVLRDPVDAMMNGAVPRANRMGRTVPLDTHIDTHIKSLETIQKLAEKYKDDESVEIIALDNNQGRGNAKELALAELAKVDYNKAEIKKALQSELQKSYEQGTISEKIYQGFIGSIRKSESLEKTSQKTSASESQRSGKEEIDLLIKKVSKYKSAEEFIKSQGDFLYHGTNEVFDKFDLSKSRFKGEQGANLWGFGIYTSPNIGTAKNYGKNVLEIIFTPKKPLNLSDFKSTKELADYLDMSEDALMMRNGLPTAKGQQASQLSDKAKELGHDAIVAGQETVILDSSDIKTKKELIDIYNQAKEVTVSSPESRQQGSLKPVSTKSGQIKKSQAYQNARDRIAEEFRNDPTYTSLKISEETAKALEFYKAFPEQAVRIAKGLAPAPDGYTDTAISLASAEQALADGNLKLHAQLESARSLRQTRRGQEIVMERGRVNENSAHHFVSQVLKARLDAVIDKNKFFFNEARTEANKLTGRVKSKTEQAVSIIDQKAQKLKKQINKATIDKLQSAQEILTQLTCKV